MKRIIWSKLLEWKQQTIRKPLILRGARQTGKTWLLRAFGGQFDRCHYFNFEKDLVLSDFFTQSLNPKKIISSLEFYVKQKIDIDKDLIIFDEIQLCPQALTSLKYFCEEVPGLALVSAGSLLGLHLGKSSFPVGKVQFLDLFPMTFFEFLDANKQDLLLSALKKVQFGDELPLIAHQQAWELFKHYLVTGGLPEVVKTYVLNKDSVFDAFNKVRKVQKDLLDTYAADMAKHSGKENSMHIDRVWKAVPAQLARSIEGNTSRFRFKNVIGGINRYNGLVGVIDWLEGAGLILKVPIIKSAQIPLSSACSENIFKLYIFDVGLLGTLGDLSPETILKYDYGSYKGYVAENYVAQEFIASGRESLFCWEGRTSEIEFVISSDGYPVPIEVKAGRNTQSKSMAVFDNKYKPGLKCVISSKQLTFDKDKGIQRIPLYLTNRFPFI